MRGVGGNRGVKLWRKFAQPLARAQISARLPASFPSQFSCLLAHFDFSRPSITLDKGTFDHNSLPYLP